ncbi:uncharacterized protein B0T15DRAFT_551533 [Chaetomium strumarium]|uniref:Uncharacterized protein n=1 Tax=Chaetomium strumarium TaxID=1170767 RepID=A0AAJ0GZT8_9PEZI|nr:hypothetical protein B0T15DRAFT_551533 [Chaetomium strumarium]
MGECATPASAIRRPNRTKLGQSPAITSTDWRRRNDSSSSAAAAACGPQYRHPNRKTAPWENVVSAPVCPVSSSSSSSSSAGDEERLETATVRLRAVNHMTTSVNNEIVRLPNQFVFEVTPVRANQSSRAGIAVARLRPLNGPTRLPSTTSEGRDFLLANLQEIIRQSEDVTSSQVARHAPTDPSHDDDARFRTLLSRLSQRPQRPQPSVAEPGGKGKAVPRPFVDPAIIAMKLKDDAPGTSSGSSGRKPQSADSGYASGTSGERSESNRSDTTPADSRNGHLHTRKESSTDGTKALNPAAAEFKSVMKTDADHAVPFSPKKLSRQPLTNIFPNVMSARSPVRGAPAQENTLAGLSQRNGATAAPAAGTGSLPRPEAYHPHAGLYRAGYGSLSGTVPGGLAALTPMPMAAALAPAAGLAHSSPLLAATLGVGAYPSMTPVGAHHGLYHTYPPPPTAVPLLAPSPQVAAAGTLSIATTPVPPLAATAAKPPRAWFPVTEKPRDHDPVKQQLYEQYLEWRKANEPGYHMSCKMRQAQRCEGAAATAAAGGAAGWKEASEKTKEAVAAVAKAAAAEKARRTESVREELKAKVASLSRESRRERVEIDSIE